MLLVSWLKNPRFGRFTVVAPMLPMFAGEKPWCAAGGFSAIQYNPMNKMMSEYRLLAIYRYDPRSGEHLNQQLWNNHNTFC
jgi:hypothetical protein